MLIKHFEFEFERRLVRKNRWEQLPLRTDVYRHRKEQRVRRLARKDEIQKSTWKVDNEKGKLKMTTK